MQFFGEEKSASRKGEKRIRCSRRILFAVVLDQSKQTSDLVVAPLSILHDSHLQSSFELPLLLLNGASSVAKEAVPGRW